MLLIVILIKTLKNLKPVVAFESRREMWG
jgi:hypothetical protein